MEKPFENGKWYLCTKDTVAEDNYSYTPFWRGYIYLCVCGTLRCVMGSYARVEDVNTKNFVPFDFKIEEYIKEKIDKKKECDIISEIRVEPSFSYSEKTYYSCIIVLNRFIGNRNAFIGHGPTQMGAYEQAMRKFKLNSNKNNKLYSFLLRQARKNASEMF